MADRVARARWTVEGGVLAIAVWCTLYALHILPGSLRVVPGVLGTVAVGLVVGGIGGRRVEFAMLAAASVVAAIVMCTDLSDRVLSRWERGDAMPDTGVAAAVILSAGLNADTTISGEALDHLLTGLDLVHTGRAPVLVTTTTTGRFPEGAISSEIDQARIIGLLGAPVHWIRVPGGRTTRDEAIASDAYLRPRGIRRIAVVTSPMHTRRACAAFEAVGFSVTCVPARLRGPGNSPLAEVPGARLEVFGAWVYELAATATYRLRGWLPA